MNPEFVLARLREFYPDSNKLSLPIAIEICTGFERKSLGETAFDDALTKYRAKDRRHAWPPTLRDLQPYLPTRVQRSVRNDQQGRGGLWPRYLRRVPEFAQAASCWQRADYVGYWQTLLSVAGLQQEDRQRAEFYLGEAQRVLAEREKQRDETAFDCSGQPR